MNLTTSGAPAESDELIELVDRFLDQRLDEAGAQRLETLLREDPQASRYCAERIRLHSELHSLSKPLRIEIKQGHELVIEHRDGQSTVTAQRLGEVNVGPVPGGPAVGEPRHWRWKVVSSLAIAAAIGFGFWGVIQYRENELLKNASMVSLSPLENSSFEASVLEDGERSKFAPGWDFGGGYPGGLVINAADDPNANPFGGPHLPPSARKLDGSNALLIARGQGEDYGWAKQRLYGQTALGPRVLQLADIDGRVIRVSMDIARPAFESGLWAAEPVRLRIGFQEPREPWRMAALYLIDTGDDWEEADLRLGLDHGQLTRITFDLPIDAGEMRGDAYFHVAVHYTTPPKSEVLVDHIELELLD